MSSNSSTAEDSEIKESKSPLANSNLSHPVTEEEEEKVEKKSYVTIESNASDNLNSAEISQSLGNSSNTPEKVEEDEDNKETILKSDSSDNELPILEDNNNSIEDNEMIMSPAREVMSCAAKIFSEVINFSISKNCKLVIQRGDITKWSINGETDAIVNAANEAMLGGGGVDGAIHRAAGPELLEACKRVKPVKLRVRCPVGEARITKGFRLPSQYVIHTVGPFYTSDAVSPKLKSAYVNSLLLAQKHNIEFICFPAISCGVYGYPVDKAADISLNAIKKLVMDENINIKEVHFALFEESVWNTYARMATVLFNKPC